MKKLLLILVSVIGMASLLFACSEVSERPRIQTAEGKITFVFFYTEN